MPKHRPPPSNAAGPEQGLDTLLAAMGIAEDNPFLRVGLAGQLEQIEREYARRVAQLSKQPSRKQVRQYRAVATKHLLHAKKVGRDFLAQIEEAGWSRHNPNADVGHLHMVVTDWMTEHGEKPLDLIAVLADHELNIDHLLKTSGDTYRKRDVRKLVVEPFLRLMAESKITTSRKQLPRKRIFDALFDWIGVEKKFRPSDASINATARDLEARASDLEVKR